MYKIFMCLSCKDCALTCLTLLGEYIFPACVSINCIIYYLVFPSNHSMSYPNLPQHLSSRRRLRLAIRLGSEALEQLMGVDSGVDSQLPEDWEDSRVSGMVDPHHFGYLALLNFPKIQKTQQSQHQFLALWMPEFWSCSTLDASNRNNVLPGYELRVPSLLKMLLLSSLPLVVTFGFSFP